MEPLVSRRQRYNHCVVAPGAVGSVGDVNVSVRLKQSSPEQAIRWENEFSGAGSTRLGSEITDGESAQAASARVKDSNWQSGRGFQTANGWRWQDFRAADMMVEPYVGSTFDFDWRNKIATTYELKRPGNLFLPLPGPYVPAPGELSRGAAVRVTAVEPGDLPPQASVVVPASLAGVPTRSMRVM